MSTDNKLIHTQPHTGGEKEVTIKRRPGRPKGSVANKQNREAMKRQFSRVITPKKFRDMVEKVYDQGMEGDKSSQKLIFEYGMIKPGMEVEHAGGDYGVQIIINDMKPEKEVIDDAVWEEKEESSEA
jgi:hypothetical protein